ncbi:hypothetical protein HUW46_02752 [Amycolatopsis sp. CA-230715]|nr:hypothetical protein HUW46_02752 [Amycolatopsis sp. CA-230715]
MEGAAPDQSTVRCGQTEPLPSSRHGFFFSRNQNLLVSRAVSGRVSLVAAPVPLLTGVLAVAARIGRTHPKLADVQGL